jgi:hypothetical protein
MTPEIRKAAVRAAAKAALVTMLVGCGGSDTKPVAGPSNTASGAPMAASVDCATHLGALAAVPQGELAAGDPAKDRNDVYGKVFSDRAARESAETQKCCTEELTKSGAGSKLRWECCSALPADPSGACTPWGPPCPPEMPRYA